MDEAFFVLALVVCVVPFAGEPDIVDLKRADMAGQCLPMPRADLEVET